MNIADLVPQLFLIAFGAVLTLIATVITNWQTARTSIRLAIAQRRFAAGREAYKEAIAALDRRFATSLLRRKLAGGESFLLADQTIAPAG